MEPSQVYRRDILEIEAVMPEFEAAREERKEDDEKPPVHSKHFVFPEGWLQLALFIDSTRLFHFSRLLVYPSSAGSLNLIYPRSVIYIVHLKRHWKSTLIWATLYADRKLGYFSTALLIVNRMVGTGIFSTPSTIMQATNSVGAALLFWVLGGIMCFW